MKNMYLWGAAAIILVAAIIWLTNSRQAGIVSPSSDLGTYAYRCADGSEFTMAPASDVASIALTGGAKAAFGAVTLAKTDSSAGQRFEGGGIVFVGAGEGVTLTAGGKTTTCDPVPSQDSPPWNWGDAGEGGSVKPDVTLVVGESIVGTWKSNEDAKFVREFKNGGKVDDLYDGKVVSSGTFSVFTKAKPLTVPFPLQDDAVYVQLTMQGTQADHLNFKVVKLTPETLELVYMDRGGTLTFTAVK